MVWEKHTQVRSYTPTMGRPEDQMAQPFQTALYFVTPIQGRTNDYGIHPFRN